ncbi:hypothetical protein [Shewanella indica]|uniref:hypothetical protein n=1 Tax=Shewanella indica TaxID=768528 RepID=UPI00399B81B1
MQDQIMESEKGSAYLGNNAQQCRQQQEPTEASPAFAPNRSRNPRRLRRGGCQNRRALSDYSPPYRSNLLSVISGDYLSKSLAFHHTTPIQQKTIKISAVNHCCIDIKNSVLILVIEL